DIFAGAFAQYFRSLSYIEDIVDDLESEPKPLSELRDCRKLFGVCIGAHSAEAYRAFQYGCRFVLVDKSQLVTFHFSAFRFKIGGLTSNQFLASGCNCDLAQQN